MERVTQFLKKIFDLRFEDGVLEQLFMSTIIEQISYFQIHFGSLVLIVYSIINGTIAIWDTSQQDNNRGMRIGIFCAQMFLSIIVLLLGHFSQCLRSILMYAQYLFFITTHSALIIHFGDTQDKIFTLIAFFCINFCVMPQANYQQILLCSAFSFSLLLFSLPLTSYHHIWQLWVLFGFVGIELRLFIDEKQKRILFYDETKRFQKNGQERNGQERNFLLPFHDFNQKELESAFKNGDKDDLPSSRQNILGIQQKMSKEGFGGDQGTLNNEKQSQENINPKRLSIVAQENTINRNIRGFSFLTSYPVDSPSVRDQNNSIQGVLKRNASVFQIQKGVEDAKKQIQMSFLQDNLDHQMQRKQSRWGYESGMANSPFFGNSPQEIQQTFTSKTQNIIQNGTLFKWLPFSVMHGSIDPQRPEIITLISANEKARNNHQIIDSQKFDDFLKKCKITSSLSSKISLDKQDNSLKQLLVLKFNDIFEERQPNEQSSPRFHSNYNSINISPMSMRPSSQFYSEQKNNFSNFMNPISEKEGQNTPTLSQNNSANKIEQIYKPPQFEMMVEIMGKKQQWAVKLIIFQNEEFVVIMNDDSIEKLLLEQKKKAACLKLLSQVDSIGNRIHCIQQMIAQGNTSRRDIFFENFMVVNYLLNSSLFLQDILKVRLEFNQQRFELLDVLKRLRSIIKRDSKKSVVFLIDSNIPMSCKQIYTDQFYLGHALANIMENAYSNTSKGFVQILVNQSYIFEGNLRFDIIDSGHGFDEKQIKLFNQSEIFSSQPDEDLIPDSISKLDLQSNNVNSLNIKNQDQSYISLKEREDKLNDEEINGFGLKFSINLIKLLGPYNRIFAESKPGIGTRISFVIYKDGIPFQDGDFHSQQLKNDNFENEMAFFNPLYSINNQQTNVPLDEYISLVLDGLSPPFYEETSSQEIPLINKPIVNSFFNCPNFSQSSTNRSTKLVASSNSNQSSSNKANLNNTIFGSQTNCLINQTNNNKMNKDRNKKSGQQLNPFSSKKTDQQHGNIQKSLQDSKNGNNTSQHDVENIQASVSSIHRPPELFNQLSQSNSVNNLVLQTSDPQSQQNQANRKKYLHSHQDEMMRQNSDTDQEIEQCNLIFTNTEANFTEKSPTIHPTNEHTLTTQNFQIY